MHPLGGFSTSGNHGEGGVLMESVGGFRGSGADRNATRDHHHLVMGKPCGGRAVRESLSYDGLQTAASDQTICPFSAGSDVLTKNTALDMRNLGEFGGGIRLSMAQVGGILHDHTRQCSGASTTGGEYSSVIETETDSSTTATHQQHSITRIAENTRSVTGPSEARLNETSTCIADSSMGQAAAASITLPAPKRSFAAGGETDSDNATPSDAIALEDGESAIPSRADLASFSADGEIGTHTENSSSAEEYSSHRQALNSRGSCPFIDRPSVTAIAAAGVTEPGDSGLGPHSVSQRPVRPTQSCPHGRKLLSVRSVRTEYCRPRPTHSDTCRRVGIERKRVRFGSDSEEDGSIVVQVREYELDTLDSDSLPHETTTQDRMTASIHPAHRFQQLNSTTFEASVGGARRQNRNRGSGARCSLGHFRDPASATLDGVSRSAVPYNKDGTTVPSRPPSSPAAQEAAILRCASVPSPHTVRLATSCQSVVDSDAGIETDMLRVRQRGVDSDSVADPQSNSFPIAASQKPVFHHIDGAESSGGCHYLYHTSMMLQAASVKEANDGTLRQWTSNEASDSRHFSPSSSEESLPSRWRYGGRGEPPSYFTPRQDDGSAQLRGTVIIRGSATERSGVHPLLAHETARTQGSILTWQKRIPTKLSKVATSRATDPARDPCHLPHHPNGEACPPQAVCCSLQPRRFTTAATGAISRVPLLRYARGCRNTLSAKTSRGGGGISPSHGCFAVASGYRYNITDAGDRLVLLLTPSGEESPKKDLRLTPAPAGDHSNGGFGNGARGYHCSQARAALVQKQSDKLIPISGADTNVVTGLSVADNFS